MLSLTPNFTMADIDKDCNKFLVDIENDGLKALKGAIKFMVEKARAKTKAEKGFNNITWNLRESIGGVVVQHHEIMHTYFPKIGKGPDGRKEGIALAQEIALLLADDDQLIAVFVAGMDYSAFVEAKGWDVITLSSYSFGETFTNLLNN